MMIEGFSNRFTPIIKFCFYIMIVGSIFSSIASRFWVHFFTAIGALMSPLILYILKYFLKKKDIVLPLIFEDIFLLFIFATIYLGDINRFYEKFLWWDKIIHLVSGVVFVYLGLYIIYVLNFNRSGYLITNIYIILLFSIGLAVTAGVLWEIFEFVCDYFFGTDMQQSGLVDTMADLILDAAGALSASIFYYSKIKKHKYTSLFK